LGGQKLLVAVTVTVGDPGLQYCVRDASQATWKHAPQEAPSP